MQDDKVLHRWCSWYEDRVNFAYRPGSVGGPGLEWEGGGPRTILGCGTTGGKDAMDQLWSPWRFAYVTTADGAPRPGVPARLNAWPGDLGCVFCNLIASIDYAIEHGMDKDEAEEAGGLVKRGKSCFICLNA